MQAAQKRGVSKFKIRKGDTVQVIAGRSKGEKGQVKQVDIGSMRVLIEGVNIRKKHVRADQNNPEGGIQEQEAPIHYSNVKLLDSEGNPTRVSLQRDEKGNRIRVAKTNGKNID